MTLVKLNPTSKSLNGFMNEFFNDLPGVFGNTFRDDVSTMPQVNITEDKETYKLELNVPGRSKEDFKINIDNNILTISFEKKEEAKSENEKQIRREFSFQSFKRTFTLDDKVAVEKISAKYENGLLILSLPKKDEVKFIPKEIEIQ